MYLTDPELEALHNQALRERNTGVKANPWDTDLILQLVEMARNFNQLNSRYDLGKLPWSHNDHAIYDFKLPSFVRSFIAINSLNATCTMAIRDAGHMPKLYARYEGKPVRVTLISALGDVGINEADVERGYTKRVSIRDLTDFSEEMPE